MVSIPWYALVLITAVLIAIVNIIRKHVLNHEHALELMAAESPFRALILLALIPFVQFPTGIEWGLILATTTALFFAQLYRNKSYRHLPISTVAPLMNLSPVFLLVIAVTFLGEQLSPLQLTGIICIMLGGYLLDLRGKNLFGPLKKAAGSKYTATVILTLIMMSILGALDKYGLQTIGIEPISYLFWVYLLYILLAVGVQTYRFGVEEIQEDIRKGGGWLFLAGALSMTELLILYHALAIPGVLITLVVPLRRTATLIETFVGGKIFGEQRLAQKVFASCVMIFGVLLIV
ncbi:MAG: EamA family transporter [Candidatus Woesearchaeota archaeon]